MAPKYKQEAGFFNQHGVAIRDYDSDNSEVIADCPFCGKLEHFYFDWESSLYDCKVCFESGNASTFMKKLVELGKEITTDKHLERLMEKKSLPGIEILKEHNVCRHPFRENIWMFPINNATNGVASIYLYNPRNNTFYNSKNRPQCLYRSELCSSYDKKPKSDPKQIVIAEGHWDTLVTVAGFRPSIDDGYTEVVGVPGAGQFKEPWLKFVKHKNVILLYDNDKAGLEGIKRFQKLLHTKKVPVYQLACLRWKGDLPDGFDMRDLFIKVVLNDPQKPKRIKKRRTKC